jgi:hypothetical protein
MEFGFNRVEGCCTLALNQRGDRGPVAAGTGVSARNKRIVRGKPRFAAANMLFA